MLGPRTPNCFVVGLSLLSGSLPDYRWTVEYDLAHELCSTTVRLQGHIYLG